jgi:hypothetical protein
MSTNNTYLAVFIGTKNSPGWKAWNAMTDEQRNAKQLEGIEAWKAWGERYQSSVVYEGGPLGKTKRVSRDGFADITNELAAFVVVRAASHEAAVKMFERHPHFTIFPGEAVEVMPLLPVPGA